MESNIYIVDFTTDYFVQTLQKSLVQWNYGQILRIQGLHLPSAVEIHFSLQETGGEAEVRIGVTKDGVTDVQIPDFVFENKGALRDYTAYAFIYPSDIYSGETIHKIVLNIKARPKPKGFITPSDEDLFHKTIEVVNNAMNKSEGFSKVSESYAHGGTGIRPTEETDNAKYYATKADESAKSIAGVQQIVKESAQKIAEDVKQVELTKQAVDKTATDVTDTESRINQVKQNVDSIQQNVQTNKDAVDTAKKAVDASQLDVTKKSEQVTKDAQQVATDKGIVEQAKTDIGNKIQEHNVSPISHEDIRGLINGLTTRLNALADSDDESLDQLSEIVAYIKSNKTLIENITTNKVNVADIVNNLTTNVSNKTLSASMGVELKRLIDAIKVPTKVSELQNDSGYLTKHQDISGKVDKVTQEKKDLEQDTAIKKNADDILTKVDKTEQKQKDLEQDKQINQNENDIVKLAIKPTVQGNPLVLKDSADFKPVELEVNGSTSQIQTTGKNLFDISKCTFGNHNATKVSKLKNGFEISVIAETSSPYGHLNIPIYFESDKKYYISFNISLGTKVLIFKDGTYVTTLYENDKFKNPLTNLVGDGYALYVYTGSNKTINITDIQISIENIPYEPYTGGKPSPSPEYPQEIVNGVINRVGCNGKNLLNPINMSNELIPLDIKAGTYLNLFTDGTPSLGGNIQVQYQDGSVLWVPIDKGKTQGSRPKLAKNAIGYFNILVDKENMTKHHALMFDDGKQSIFEPYKGFTSPIQPIELSKWDKIKKIDDVWKKENNTARYVVNDTNVNMYQQSEQYRFVLIFEKVSKKDRNECLCNKYRYNKAPLRNSNECFAYNNTVLIYSTFQSVEEFKQNIKTDALDLMYETLTPTYEILPQETQDVLNKIQTFYPNSTIQTNDGIELNLKYIADTKNYIDNEIAEIKKAIVATGGV